VSDIVLPARLYNTIMELLLKDFGSTVRSPDWGHTKEILESINGNTTLTDKNILVKSSFTFTSIFFFLQYYYSLFSNPSLWYYYMTTIT
jgi:hypothetical protein